MARTGLKKLAILTGATLMVLAAGSSAALACCKVTFDRVKPHVNAPLPPSIGSGAQGQTQAAPAGAAVLSGKATPPKAEMARRPRGAAQIYILGK